MKLGKNKLASTARGTAPRQIPRVQSYYTTVHTPPNDDRGRGQKHRPLQTRRLAARLMRNAGYIVMAASLVIMFGYVLSLSNEPIVIPSEQVRDSAQYRNFLSTSLTRNILNITKITLQRGSLIEALKKKFPEVTEVTVTTDTLGHRPRFDLDISAAHYQVNAVNGSFIVGDNGVVVGRISELTQQDSLTTIRDETNVPLASGQGYMRADDASFYSEMGDYVSAAGLRLEYIRITGVQREAYVKIKEDNFEVRLYLNEPARDQVGTWLAARKTLAEQGSLPGQYLDVRAGEKVYYQ